MRNRKGEKEGRRDRENKRKRRKAGRQAGKKPYVHKCRSETKSSSVAVSPPPYAEACESQGAAGKRGKHSCSRSAIWLSHLGQVPWLL